MAAYFHAFELASKRSNITVEILLETGSHYITPAHIEAFHSSLDKQRGVDIDNTQFSLSIMPLTCSAKDEMALRYQSTNCQDPALYAYNVVSLFNKAGASFSIRVPRSLRFVGIYFDAMDSLVKQTSKTSNVAGRDCFWYSTGKYNCPDIADKTLMISTDTNPICAYRSYDSIF